MDRLCPPHRLGFRSLRLCRLVSVLVLLAVDGELRLHDPTSHRKVLVDVQTVATVLVCFERTIILLRVAHVRLDAFDVRLIVFHVGDEEEILRQSGVVEVGSLLDVVGVVHQTELVIVPVRGW